MRFAIFLGALSALMGIVLAAWTAHGLRDTLSAEDLDRIAVGVRLQIWHALALLVVGALAAMRPSKALDYATWAFVLGTVLFSGGIYFRVLFGSAAIGFLTPVGGIAYFAGWVALAYYGLREHALRKTD